MTRSAVARRGQKTLEVPEAPNYEIPGEESFDDLYRRFQETIKEVNDSFKSPNFSNQLCKGEVARVSRVIPNPSSESRREEFVVARERKGFRVIDPLKSPVEPGALLTKRELVGSYIDIEKPTRMGRLYRVGGDILLAVGIGLALP